MTTLFTAADLLEMQAFSDANLTDTCVVSLPVEVDIPGGTKTTYTASRTLACRVLHPSKADLERLAAAQITVKPTCVVDVAVADAAIDPTARLTLTGLTITAAGNIAWARTVEIIGDDGPVSQTMFRRYPCRDV